MCIVSMVHDYYEPRFKPYRHWPTITTYPNNIGQQELDEAKKLIKEWKEAKAAAERIDVLTEQPDCVDREKAKLAKRVEQLENEIAQLERRLSATEKIAELNKQARPIAKSLGMKVSPECQCNKLSYPPPLCTLHPANSSRDAYPYGFLGTTVN